MLDEMTELASVPTVTENIKAEDGKLFVVDKKRRRVSTMKNISFLRPKST